jgi:hypothetical protein
MIKKIGKAIASKEKVMLSKENITDATSKKKRMPTPTQTTRIISGSIAVVGFPLPLGLL